MTLNNKYNWEEIQKYYDNNGTWRGIKRIFGCSDSTILKATRLGVLKTRNKKDSAKLRKLQGRYNHLFVYRKSKYDWKEIQSFYDIDKTWRDIKKEFGMSDGTIYRAVKKGNLKLRNKIEAANLHFKKFGGRKLTDETKQKISKSMVKYLTENPDRVPYLVNHSSKKSWPEEVFENALISSEILGWKYKYQNGIYQYDFAFPDKKIDVEIDGGTHELEKVKKIDNRRDEFSIQNGWIVIRFTAKRVKKDVIGCINELKNLLSSMPQ